MQGAGIIQLTHLYPAVPLEHSRFISSVACNTVSTSMTVTFIDSMSFQTAFDDWSTHRTGFLLISYVAGCGAGVESSERSFHLVSGIVASRKNLQIVCRAQTLPIHHTVDQDQEIHFHVATYSVNDPGPTSGKTPPDTPSELHARSFLSDLGNFAISLSPVAPVFQLVKTYPINSHPRSQSTLSTQSIKAYDSMFIGPDNDAYLLYHRDFNPLKSRASRQTIESRVNDGGKKNSTSTTNNQ
ncbi:hypothetical protein B0H10DRAFT_639569 [Mycena sp. CBHHK59/15]|nr:hypothetical protein B0H10DRAFT_639569 [Mycena sp. CBHHK59/15]